MSTGSRRSYRACVRRVALAGALLAAVPTLGALSATAAYASSPPGGCEVSATLMGANEAPVPTNSTATGTADIMVDPSAGHVTFVLSVSGLSSGAAAAHIHQAPVGVAGPIVVPLPLGTAAGQTSFTDNGTGTPSSPAFDLMQLCTNTSSFYVNVHSSTFPGGEIRGQLALVSAGPPIGSGSATPELGSGELLATGLLPLGAVLLYRRRRARRTTQER